MPMLHGDTVSVLRRESRDEFGGSSFAFHHDIHNVGLDWVTELDWSSHESSFSKASEFREQRSYQVVMYAPVGADILASDRIELPDGDVYTVAGRPQRWKSPLSGRQPGVVVFLKHIEG